VDGTIIPQTQIINRLHLLYASGATPGLMVGVSKYESWNWHQFLPVNDPTTYCYANNVNDFGINGSWPYQSCEDSGSHIGLMMVETAMVDAYDWTANTEDGVNLFVNQKLDFARSYESYFMNLYPSLPALTPSQTERDGLVFYGDAAGTVWIYKTVSGQRTRLLNKGAYWIPDPNTHTSWVQNSANAKAIGYVNNVLAGVQ
jgi:hypothetical protein